VDSSKFEQAFGMKATPIQEAIKATVAWHRDHPQSSGSYGLGVETNVERF
jgi:hypothetical protein